MTTTAPRHDDDDGGADNDADDDVITTTTRSSDVATMTGRSCNDETLDDVTTRRCLVTSISLLLLLPLLL